MSPEGGARHPRSRRCAIPPQAARLQRLGNPDYQDAFAVHIDPSDQRPALVWAQALFGEQAQPIESLLLMVGWLLRIPQGPLHSPERVVGLTTYEQSDDAIVIGGDGPALRLRMVIQAPSETAPLTMSTFLRFRRTSWQYAGSLLLIAHRRVVPLMLERVARGSAIQRTRGVSA